jgi:hypothetical protein
MDGAHFNAMPLGFLNKESAVLREWESQSKTQAAGGKQNTLPDMHAV